MLVTVIIIKVCVKLWSLEAGGISKRLRNSLIRKLKKLKNQILKKVMRVLTFYGR